MVSFFSKPFGTFFEKNMVFLPCFFLFLQLIFHFQSLLNQLLSLKNAQHLQDYCFFFSFFGGRNIKFILFYLDLLYIDKQQCLAIQFDFFVGTMFFKVLIFYFYFYFFSYFLDVETYNLFYFIFIFWIQIISKFYLIYLFVQYLFGYSFFIFFIVFLSQFLEAQSYNLFYLIFIF